MHNHCSRLQNVHFRLTRVAQKRPIIPSLNLNTDSKTKRIVINRSVRIAGCLYYRGKCCKNLGIFGDQNKCPKWKTCLCYRGSNIHCRISINTIGNYFDYGERSVCIKFGTFAGLWSYIQWYVGLWVH